MSRTPASVMAWRRRRSVADFAPFTQAALRVFAEVRAAERFDELIFGSILKRHPRAPGQLFSKNLLVRIYRDLCERGVMAGDEVLLERLRMKPTRSLSGVTTISVLTRPHPCPGACIFCPTDARMPKSYLPDEPGAQRAAQHAFDPRDQVANRLETLHTNGHATDKVELLILGGTWSSYPETYQEWFVRRCLDAMNGRPAATLTQAQAWNAAARHRNVGLVIETRPDHVSPREIRRLRRLGVTKVQLGVQSLDDRVLELNRRGHDTPATRRAVILLRAAGFKLVLHWMPNLLGATPASDREDFRRLFVDEALRPDEIKIYPCSLLRDTELHGSWLRGDFQPYDDPTLIDLVAACKAEVPPYCRINRVYRDIPAPNIVAGCRISNLRQEAQARLSQQGRSCRCIRCREVRDASIAPAGLRLRAREYATTATTEVFLSFETVEETLAGYLRLSLPTSRIDLGLPEIEGAAMLRELHVYGPALTIGGASNGKAQHAGLGTRLLAAAEACAVEHGFARVAVIAAVGTRHYYAARRYRLDATYMVKDLPGA